MARVRELLRESADSLPGDSPRRDGEILLGHCLGRPRSWLYAWPEREVGADCTRRFRELLQRRGQGVPVAHLTGEREFWSLALRVTEHTLIPRPETETLVEWALQLPLPPDARVLDLGTGAGAIALALAAERPGWQVGAVDRCPRALQVARDNASALDLGRVRFFQSDWYASVVGRFHLLVSNPPYIAPGDPHLVRGDVRFEPVSALVAADEGLADIASLAEGARDRLLPGGWLLVEHGCEQGPAVRELLLRHGLQAVQTRCDLAGRERVSAGCCRAV